MEPKESISASIVVKEKIKKVVLMPGDPLRAKALADKYLSDVVCFNDTRNMLGYTGTYKGKRISVMGHGMGVPSVGIYTHELFTQFGVEAVIRIGSAGGLDMDVNPMDVVIAEAASTNSNYGNAYGIPGQLAYGGVGAELRPRVHHRAERCRVACVRRPAYRRRRKCRARPRRWRAGIARRF